MAKSEKVKQIEKIIWDNLNIKGAVSEITHRGKGGETLLEEIVGHSFHGHDIPLDYFNGVDIWTEYLLDTERVDYSVCIVPRIVSKYVGKMGVQPVAAKIDRLADDEETQRNICKSVLWKGVSEEDIKQIAFETADEYNRGDRWMSYPQEVSMREFYPSVSKGNVGVNWLPGGAIWVRPYLEYGILKNLSLRKVLTTAIGKLFKNKETIGK